MAGHYGMAAMSSPRRYLLALLFTALCVADKPPFFQSEAYNNASLGQYVNQTFRSSPVTAARFNFMQPFSNCEDGSYIFVAPRGEIADSTPMIFDSNGSLIWAPDVHYGEVYNFQVQQYQGQSYLTFWAGNDSIGGHGVGSYYMLDQHYELYRKIDGANGLGADLHSFTITDQGTALASAYDKMQADIASRLPSKTQATANTKRWIWDSLFQELDMQTGEAIFQWRATDHFDFSESYIRMRKATMEDPYDWFHINTVDKDAAGNYLISSRHLRCIAYISGQTGEVLWRLGGKKNSFTDLSGGKATNFLGQHDAHWSADHRFITLFDNRADWDYHTEKLSRGVRIEVDLEKMTARLDASFDHPENILSVAQGSYQTLPNGNVLVGYGNNAVMTEYTHDGVPLCDAYFEPSRRWGSGDVQSYKNLKFNWTGLPNTNPSMVLDGASLWVSWKGSTEVKSWFLEDALTADGRFGPAGPAAKTGFETEVMLQGDLRMRRFVRAVALNVDGMPLALSAPVDIGQYATVTAEVDFVSTLDIDEQTAEFLQLRQDFEDMGTLFALGGLVVVCALVVFWLTVGSRRYQPWYYTMRRMLHVRTQDSGESISADMDWIEEDDRRDKQIY